MCKIVVTLALQRSDCPRIFSRGTWGLPSLKLCKKVASPELKKAIEEAEVAHGFGGLWEIEVCE